MSLINDEASLLFAQSFEAAIALAGIGGFPLIVSRLLTLSGLLQLQPHLAAVCWVKLLLLLAPIVPYTGADDDETLLLLLGAGAKLIGQLLFS